ncbi:ATP-binding protein [Candidatus Chloroploca sp. Khr17]|uniref:ATP-binding protein n=1 Tax=Candidatus Chloroploca sp. Khr17 TaxID=2496869 RepID=UPI00101CF259|nr:ATP-binding protein [Candidatus Chloroploca sp. Khr17]
MRFFNTAGPCNPEDHYMLPATARLPDVPTLLDQKAYFVVHGPRQSGKTTAMIELARQVTAAGRYTAALVSMEVGAAFNDDPGAAELAILEDWRAALVWQFPTVLQPPPWPDAEAGGRLGAALTAWCMASSRPVVLFIDEIDALQDAALISALRQLRAGFQRRPTAFPWALALIGLRDVRDYKVASGGSERLHTASPFNIKVESLTLRNFTTPEVAELYAQHTADTGQVFTPEALRLAFDLTQGQPWLVNALARQAVQVVVPDPAQSVDVVEINQAKELLIQRQDTHLDSLAERLREPRVRHVIEPLLAGQSLTDVPADDRQFVLDLGLVRRDPAGGLVIANPIYREVIPRVLASGPQDSLPHIRLTWLRPDGGLDPDKLLEAFLAFWRQHGQPLLGSAHYHEIAPHLVLMAFLHRVVNGGGTLEREYAIGSGRIDLCLRYGDVTLGIELKVWRDGERDPQQQGLAQLDAYLNGLGLPTGWLVIFERRRGQPPISERTSSATAVSPAGRVVTVIRG